MENYRDSFTDQMRDELEAKAELIKWKAVKESIKHNDLACTIEINGIKVGLCNNSKLLGVCNHNISEINKFLEGEKNEWE